MAVPENAGKCPVVGPRRHVPHFPAAGEVVTFDSSWHDRAGVERVVRICREERYRRVLGVGLIAALGQLR